MLAYAASRPVIVDRRPHPNMMLMIIGAHVAVAALVMSARMDLPGRIIDHPLKVFWLAKPKDQPRPRPIQNQVQPKERWIGHTRQQVRTPPIVTHEIVATGTTAANMGQLGGAGVLVIPEIPHATFTPINSGPQLLTPSSELRPPYPPSKLLNEEEAVLHLKLTIDGNGRVVAVDPVGRTDAVFLDAARRHLITHWRYKPAMDGGQPIASSTVITLRFQLDG